MDNEIAMGRIVVALERMADVFENQFKLAIEQKDTQKVNPADLSVFADSSENKMARIKDLEDTLASVEASGDRYSVPQLVSMKTMLTRKLRKAYEEL